MHIFETIFPILVILLCGYLAARSHYLSSSDCDSLSKFVFTFIVPSLLFIGTVKAKIPNTMEWQFLFSYYSALLFIYFISVFLAKVIFKFSAAAQSVFSMGASYSNATIVGLPVCIYALGEEAMLPLFIIISIHNLILFTVGIIVAERNQLSFSSLLKNIKIICKELITSPITCSLLIGGLVNIINIPIYQPLEQSILLISNAAIPTALFALGTSLNKFKIQGNIMPAIVMVIIKIIFFPVLVWFLVFQVFNISPLWASTALLTSAMPVGISAYIFSKKYQVCEASIATGIIISTTASLLTLSIVIAYIKTVI